jgi:HSP20 family protein
MPVVRRQSLRDLLLLQDRMNGVFEDSLRDMSGISEPGEWVPHVDIFEDDISITMKAELPGMKHDDIMLDISNGMLTLSGRKHLPHEDQIESYHIIERQYGSFRRSFNIPDIIDSDKIEARYENGVLEVVLPKIKQEVTRQIPITQGRNHR